MNLPPNINWYRVKEIPVFNIKRVHTEDFYDFLCMIGLSPFCWVKKYIDPVISPITHAVSIDETDFHILAGYVTGTIKHLVDNSQSQDGSSYEQNAYTGKTRNRHTIEDSATIDQNGIYKHFIHDISELLAEVEAGVSGVKAGNQTNITATFRKDGYWKLIKSIYEYFIYGTVNIDSGIDITVTYNWFGQQTKKFHIDVNADLPVLSVTWNAW